MKSKPDQIKKENSFLILFLLITLFSLLLIIPLYHSNAILERIKENPKAISYLFIKERDCTKYATPIIKTDIDCFENSAITLTAKVGCTSCKYSILDLLRKNLLCDEMGVLSSSTSYCDMQEATCRSKCNNSNYNNTFLYLLEVQETTRQYAVYIPSKYNSEKEYPLILSFHGAMGNGIQQCRDSNLMQTAEKYGFILACPYGTQVIGGLDNRVWNDGYLFENSSPISKVNDTLFTLRMLEDLSSKYNINSNQTYSTGLSNGAIFSYKLACELSDKILAISPVAGSMSGMIPHCNPNRSIPVIIFHGLNDTNVHYYGGSGEGLSKYSHPSVNEAVNFWILNNNLSATPTSTGRRGNATFVIYGNEDESQVILWTLEDGGHTWPGGSMKESFGKTNRDISANEEMWEFFQKYTSFNNLVKEPETLLKPNQTEIKSGQAFTIYTVN